MKNNEIKKLYGENECCANCQHYLFDETCNVSNNIETAPDYHCADFKKRKKYKGLIITTSIITAFTLLFFSVL